MVGGGDSRVLLFFSFSSETVSEAALKASEGEKHDE